jgi:hypothetical protein
MECQVRIQGLSITISVEFLNYMKYVRKLKFEEKPDYHYLRRSFKELFLREGHEFDYVYDWILIPLVH